MKSSDLEDAFALQCERFKLPPAIREHPFAKDSMGRRWRLDWYWPQYMLGVELHGLCQGAGRRGGHETIPGMTNDMDKKNTAILLGIDVLTFTQSHVASMDAISVTMRALTVKGWKRPQ